MLTLKPSNEIMKTLSKILMEFNIKYKKKTEFFFYCEKNLIKFEIEIMKLDSTDKFRYVRINKINGEIKDYKAIMKQILGGIYL